jgi:hypothetical protein
MLILPPPLSTAFTSFLEGRTSRRALHLSGLGWPLEESSTCTVRSMQRRGVGAHGDAVRAGNIRLEHGYFMMRPVEEMK